LPRRRRDYGEQWTITSDAGGIVTGTVYGPNNSFGHVCGSWTFDVSGSIASSLQTDGVQGYTFFTLTTSNPSPSGPLCGVYPKPAEFNDTIQNDGNDRSANVSWSYVGGGGSGTTNFTKTFSSGPGATQDQFRQILNSGNGSGGIFKGRQIQEYMGFGSPD
jgi:hypothetical protein